VSCCFDFRSLLSAEFDDNAGHGLKRKYDDEDDTPDVNELEETLMKTCITKLSGVTVAKGSRCPWTLRHKVLVHNMLRSLERAGAGKPQNLELQSERARITARRHSSDIHLSTTNSTGTLDRLPLVPAERSSTSSELSIIRKQEPQPQELSLSSWIPQRKHLLSWEQKQQLEQLSLPWQPQQQLELLPFTLDVDNNGVMSSPTATFCPLLAVDLTRGLVGPLSEVKSSQLELEMLDISCDYNLYNTTMDFYESRPFHK